MGDKTAQIAGTAARHNCRLQADVVASEATPQHGALTHPLTSKAPAAAVVSAGSFQRGAIC